MGAPGTIASPVGSVWGSVTHTLVPWLYNATCNRHYRKPRAWWSQRVISPTVPCSSGYPGTGSYPERVKQGRAEGVTTSITLGGSTSQGDGPTALARTFLGPGHQDRLHIAHNWIRLMNLQQLKLKKKYKIHCSFLIIFQLQWKI